MSYFIKQSDNKASIPIEAILTGQFPAWIEKQESSLKNWVNNTGFKAKPGEVCLVSGSQGQVSKVLFGWAGEKDYLQFGRLPLRLMTGSYHIENNFSVALQEQIAIAWALGAYQFTHYKAQMITASRLVLSDKVNIKFINDYSDAMTLVRDMINIPTDDMGPEQIAENAKRVAKKFDAEFSQIVGDDLLKNNYPVIHAVGRASVHPPRLIDIRWGDKSHPKITLVGKGVCFDSGGLNLKQPPGMRYMKKDMAGAANVLGLASLIMTSKLPVRLRVLIPAVENAVSGNSYHPGDIIKSRKGTTIEVTNTDAEGRLILADALTEACSENPELVVDIATLTAAARVAVGNEISALFTQDDELANVLYDCGNEVDDPIWRLPLFEPYRKQLESPVADLVNAVLTDGAGGAILAALFLSEFVPLNIKWAHFDIMAWNRKTVPARPEGGDGMAIRAVYRYLQKKYQ